VVVRNILKLMNGQAIDGGYDGYASCPLTTANGKAIIAEFLNPGKERWVGWWIKASFLPIMYWQYMLKGYEWFPKHNTAFKEPTVG
jgi:sulfide:quinone oxidoreductase